MSVSHCDECGAPWHVHTTTCVREMVTPSASLSRALHPIGGPSGSLYEAGFTACLAHIAAMPTIALHCTKPGESDKYVPADQRAWHTDHGFVCTPMIYRPLVTPTRAASAGAMET